MRRRFGENIFEVVFEGATERLRDGLKPYVEVLDEAAVADSSLNQMRIRLNDGVSLRESIAAANEAVELRSFREVIPSMNDIFIKAVEGKL